jgi:hypothetical protein
LKTAVDFLVQKLSGFHEDFELAFSKEIALAKKMEKEQIIDSFQEGKNTGWYQASLEAEEYYNETFKTK